MSKLYDVIKIDREVRFRKMRVETGYVYNFWNETIKDWNFDWIFVPYDKEPESKKTKISEWIAGLPKEPSVRLYNALKNIEEEGVYEFVEDIKEYSFRKMRGAGMSTWKEFVELRELNNNINENI